MREKITSVDPETHYSFFDPFVLAVWGPPRSGKTEFSRLLARRTNIVPIDIDEIRYLITGRRSLLLPPEEEQQELREAYRIMYMLAAHRVEVDASPVALINTGSTNTHRVNSSSFAAEYGLPFVSVHIQTPAEVLEQRAEAPQADHDYSNITSREAVRHNLARIQEFGDDTLVVDGTRPLIHQVRFALDHILNVQTDPRPSLITTIASRKRVA